MKRKKLKIKKIEVRGVKRVIRRIPLLVAKHAVEFSVALLVIALIIGGSVFYKYSVKTVKDGLKEVSNECPLNETTYSKVLEVWEKDDLMFERTSSKHYYDIFSNGIID